MTCICIAYASANIADLIFTVPTFRDEAEMAGPDHPQGGSQLVIQRCVVGENRIRSFFLRSVARYSTV